MRVTLSAKSAGAAARQARPAAACRYVAAPPANLCGRRRAGCVTCRARAQEEEGTEGGTDWDDEMSIFRQRKLKPAQLETLRKKAAQVEAGKVEKVSSGVAIVTGLENDAEEGTLVKFSSGGEGVLIWRRADNLVFVLCLDSEVSEGDTVECEVKGVLQVVDEEEGPSTKREYEILTVPAGPARKGRIVDYRGRALDGGEEDGAPADLVPMFNEQVPMGDREPISEALSTGVKAIDVLTPVGRGQALLVTGPPGSGKGLVGAHAVLAQRGSDVHAVYASIGRPSAELEAQMEMLEAAGALENATVVSVPEDANLGQQFAAMATAMAIAERTRDAGGHSLVVLNDITPLVKLWDEVTAQTADFGAQFKELEDNDDLEDLSEKTQEELVEYEGMLVSASAAQRRKFFSSIIQRSAKCHRRNGAGSLTLLPVLAGVPATGEMVKARKMIEAYTTIDEEKKDKLIAALEAKGFKFDAEAQRRTETLEEFMSIADGQIVLTGERDASTRFPVPNPSASVSRIGTRAFPPAMEELAAQIRLEMAQAADAARFSSDPSDPVLIKSQRYTSTVLAALAQPKGRVMSLPEEVVQVFAIQKGFVPLDLPAAEVQQFITDALAHVAAAAPAALEAIAETQRVTAVSEKAVNDALTEFVALRTAA